MRVISFEDWNTMDASVKCNKTLEELRVQIDEADRRIVNALKDRMDISAEIALYKKEHGLPVLDPERENAKLTSILTDCREDLRAGLGALYPLIFEMSRAYQHQLIGDDLTGCGTTEQEAGRDGENKER